jgi:diguanylate cyclase (GGDEF)-like protein
LDVILTQKLKSTANIDGHSSPRSNRRRLSWSLRSLSIILFVLQFVIVVGLVGYLSFRNGQEAVNQMSVRLQTQVSHQIEQHLDNYFTSARRLNELNANAINSSLLDPENLDSLGRFFWKQAKLYQFGYVLFGTKTGNFLDAGKPQTFNLDLITERIEPKRYRDNRLYTYEPDGEGNRGRQISITEDYHFQKEAWYAEVMQKQKTLWTSVYSWQSPTANPLAIAISSPIYDQQQNLIGAIAIEQRLSQISEFIHQIKVTPATTIFIVEPNGLILANSSASKSFKLKNNKPERLKALESEDPLIQVTATHLTDRFNSFYSIRDQQQLSVLFQGQRYIGQVTPWKGELGLNWLIVTIIPESDFMGQIEANTHRTLFLCALSTMIAVVIGIATADKITQPILQLNAFAREIARGNLDLTVDIRGIQELKMLGNSLNQMVWQLQQSFNALEKQNTELISLNKRKEELEYLAEVDSLTQVANRRCFDERFQWEWQRLLRQSQSLSLILFDVDYFKRYNDAYGHQAGDECLRKIAEAAKRSVNRPEDLVCRYGGEEFAVILPNTDTHGATVIAERLCQTVRDLKIPHSQSEVCAIVTISVGVASTIPQLDSKAEIMLNQADQALYAAKRQGRDRFVVL